MWLDCGGILSIINPSLMVWIRKALRMMNDSKVRNDAYTFVKQVNPSNTMGNWVDCKIRLLHLFSNLLSNLLSL